ncbi:MAG TPA: Spy/CpxP family protein refolding chaperone [Vicinamibacterales bacterium]|nr:Spy/CpxP family protein refolding chaperone [Vicinamibacterales bacterium]
MQFSVRIGWASALLALAVLLAVQAAGQGSKWWQSDKYKRELGLTAEQSRQLEEIFQAAMPNLRVLNETLDQAEAEFERRVQKGDDSAILEQVKRVAASRADLYTARTMMLVRMRKKLTTDQWARFTAMHQAAEKTTQSGRGK